MKPVRLWLALIVLLVPAWASRVVEDDAGRKVVVPDQVRRVICLSPNITQTAYALGAAAQVVGITDFTDYPPEAQREKPSVGQLLHPSLERIASLRPDLAIGLTSMNSAGCVRSRLAEPKAVQASKMLSPTNTPNAP